MTYITPPNHFGFKAKKIFGNPISGTIKDIAIAYIEPGGGGPKPSHQHSNGHLFLVLEGEVTIKQDGKSIVVHAEEGIYIKGNVNHSTFNNSDKMLKMIGITIIEKPQDINK